MATTPMKKRQPMVDESKFDDKFSHVKSRDKATSVERPSRGIPVHKSLELIAQTSALQAKASNSRDCWDVCDDCIVLLASHSTFNRQLGDTLWDVRCTFSASASDDESTNCSSKTSFSCGLCSISEASSLTEGKTEAASEAKPRHRPRGSTSFRVKQYAHPTCSIKIHYSNNAEELGQDAVEDVRDLPDNLFWKKFEIYNIERHSLVPTPLCLREAAARHEKPCFQYYRLPPNIHDVPGSGLVMARKWMHKCRLKHAKCRIATGGLELPQYLVRIIPDSTEEAAYDLALIETCHRTDLNYAAVSYCWGSGDSPHVTTNDNCKIRLAGFNSFDMPQAIRDAVLVTRRLGLSYLWIDSLCIVQDSPDQKMREIFKIASIFSGAYITIVAASSRSVSEGFLDKPRKPEKEPPIQALNQSSSDKSGKWTITIHPERDPIKPFKVPHWDEQGRLSTLELRKAPDYFGYDPVHTRGWTLEEWMLSRRRLVFTRQQTVWICESATEWDGGYSAPGTSPYKEVLNFGAQLLQHTETRSTENDLSIETDLMRIIELYTNRFFQRKSDRLLALDGVMQRLGAELGKTLVAGCWGEDLPTFLLWRLRDASEDAEMMRGRSYYLNGQKENTDINMAYGDEIIEAMAEAYKMTINFDALRIDHSKEKFEGVPSWSWMSAKTGWVHFEGRKAKERTFWIRGIKVDVYSAKSPRLAVEGVIVRNWLAPPPLQSGCTSLCGHCPTCSLAHDMASKVSGQRIFFDCSAVSSDGLCLLPVQRNLETHWIAGLIIAEHSEPSTYHRVGFFEIISDIFLEYEHKEQKLMLV